MRGTDHETEDGKAARESAANLRVLARLGGVIAFMVALTFASVPLYDLFCRVTGFGGTPLEDRAGVGAGEIREEHVVVRFDASIEKNMPWRFTAVERKMDLRLGETGLAFYEATNTTDRPVTGSATFNVTPFSAGGYFTKIDCFCFTEQVLQPGETVQMPVTFYVDPEILEDDEARHVTEITLSYTFYEIDAPDDVDEQAALDLTDAAQDTAVGANSAPRALN